MPDLSRLQVRKNDTEHTWGDVGHKAGDQSVPVSLATGNIEIGAVEIKNATDDTRATVGVNGLHVDVQSSALPSGAATSTKQDDIITELQKKPDESTTPTVYNTTLTLADTEYSQALPANTKDFRFRCRTLYDVRFAWVTGKVATPTAPYLTLPAGSDYYSDQNSLSSQTLYFASSQAGVVVEMEVFV